MIKDGWMHHGGPAFPSRTKTDPDGGLISYRGMTLRDWFAGQCIIGLLAAQMDPVHGSQVFADDAITRAAYRFADAMLEARKR